MRHTFKPLLCISTVIIIGTGLMVFGWSRARSDLLLDLRNAVTEGRVIDGSVSTGMRGGQWSHLVVEYCPANHAPITRKFDVDAATYRTSLDTRKATVTYLPEDPEVSRVTRFAPLPFQILTWVGGLFALTGVISLLFFMKSRAKAPDGGVTG